MTNRVPWITSVMPANSNIRRMNEHHHVLWV